MYKRQGVQLLRVFLHTLGARLLDLAHRLLQIHQTRKDIRCLLYTSQAGPSAPACGRQAYPPDIAAGTAQARPQNDAEATLAPPLTKEQAHFGFDAPARRLRCV